jgi:hypothetical protein
MPIEPTTSPLICKCGNLLGKEYRINGEFIGALCGGFMITESAHGRCPNCGRGVHVVVSTKAFLKLMANYGNVPVLNVEITE